MGPKRWLCHHRDQPKDYIRHIHLFNVLRLCCAVLAGVQAAQVFYKWLTHRYTDL